MKFFAVATMAVMAAVPVFATPVPAANDLEALAKRAIWDCDNTPGFCLKVIKKA